MYTLIGLLLLPLCAASTRTLIALVEAIRPDRVQELAYGAWGLLIGFLLWLILYFITPRPIRVYVLAHELTHALWGTVMGARVSRIRVSRKGGSVLLSKTNFLITLAPYFFPFYTMIVIATFLAASLFWDQKPYEMFWLAAIGFTWGFHLTFTISMLLQRQTDIEEYGRLFSYAVIYLMNVLGICLWIVAVASPTLERFAAEWAGQWGAVWESGRALLNRWR